MSFTKSIQGVHFSNILEYSVKEDGLCNCQLINCTYRKVMSVLNVGQEEEKQEEKEVGKENSIIIATKNKCPNYYTLSNDSPDSSGC